MIEHQLARQILSGQLSLEAALKKLSPNQKAVRDNLVALLRAISMGRHMSKGYQDLSQNAGDIRLGRQSTLRPPEPNPLRAYGLDRQQIHKAIETDTCKACGGNFMPKEDDVSKGLCPNCSSNIKSTTWHKGDLA